VASQGELILQRGEWKRNGKRIVLVTGVFDLLHPGHVRLLEQARSLGDILVVGVASDASVRAVMMRERSGDSRRSGIERPITPAAERAEILAALEAADYVAEFEEPTAQKFIAAMAPEARVKGGRKDAEDSSAKEDAENESMGIKTIYVPLEPGYSTTSLLDRITQLRA